MTGLNEVGDVIVLAEMNLGVAALSIRVNLHVELQSLDQMRIVIFLRLSRQIDRSSSIALRESDPLQPARSRDHRPSTLSQAPIRHGYMLRSFAHHALYFGEPRDPDEIGHSLCALLALRIKIRSSALIASARFRRRHAP